MAKKAETMYFRVHTLNLLNEIADHAIPRKTGVLKVPLNQFKNLLALVAQRATQLNDPELNILMLRLTLYEVDTYEIVDAIKQQEKLIKK